MAKDLYFKNVEVFKDRSLGQGAFGVVYEAKCDQLVCAAKQVHRIFFSQGDPVKIVDDFQKEIQLLSRLKHPNIIQYLGTHQKQGESISELYMLMELLDCSLQVYLENHSETPLPFHLEINFSHDVALALNYLHSNKIHHRDLSANNILLLGDVRAKVSDFGVAKLKDPNMLYSKQTKAPGCVVYMPPEVLWPIPKHSETIDEFSLGVCMIQMMSRWHPNPGLLYHGQPDKDMQMIMEVDRRQEDIRCVHDAKHPMLALAKECIRNTPRERPSSAIICSKLYDLKKNN